MPPAVPQFAANESISDERCLLDPISHVAKIAMLVKSELVRRLTLRFPRLSAQDTEDVVNLILGTVSETLARGARVELRGFGVFSLNYRPSRVGRNPKSGQRIQVPGKHVPHFKAGKELRERVDRK